MAVKCKFYQLQSVEESIATTGKYCAVMSKPNANLGYWMNQATYCVRLLHHMDDIAQLEDHLSYHPCQIYLVRDWTKRFIVGVARSKMWDI